MKHASHTSMMSKAARPTIKHPREGLVKNAIRLQLRKRHRKEVKGS